MLSPSFGVSRTFETTLERLWAAFTDGTELSRWALPDGATVLRSEMALSPGGTYRFGVRLPDGNAIWGAWSIRRVEPPSLLSFEHAFTTEDGARAANPFDPVWPRTVRAEFRFAVQGGGTTVTVNLSPSEATADEAAAFRRAFSHLSHGWERALDRLDKRLSRPEV